MQQILKILLAGDTHGALDDLAKKAIEIQPDFILQVGDLGIFSSYENMDSKTKKHYRHDKNISQIFPYIRKEKEFPIPLYFIRGNHEEYGLLPDLDLPNIHYLKSGLHIINSIRIGTLGGIYYLGKNEQKAKMDKYTQPQEYWHVLKEAKDGVDILLTHDSPKGALPH